MTAAAAAALAEGEQQQWGLPDGACVQHDHAAAQALSEIIAEAIMVLQAYLLQQASCILAQARRDQGQRGQPGAVATLQAGLPACRHCSWHHGKWCYYRHWWRSCTGHYRWSACKEGRAEGDAH